MTTLELFSLEICHGISRLDMPRPKMCYHKMFLLSMFCCKVLVLLMRPLLRLLEVVLLDIAVLAFS